MLMVERGSFFAVAWHRQNILSAGLRGVRRPVALHCLGVGLGQQVGLEQGFGHPLGPSSPLREFGSNRVCSYALRLAAAPLCSLPAQASAWRLGSPRLRVPNKACALFRSVTKSGAQLTAPYFTVQIEGNWAETTRALSHVSPSASPWSSSTAVVRSPGNDYTSLGDRTLGQRAHKAIAVPWLAARKTHGSSR